MHPKVGVLIKEFPLLARAAWEYESKNGYFPPPGFAGHLYLSKFEHARVTRIDLDFLEQKVWQPCHVIAGRDYTCVRIAFYDSHDAKLGDAIFPLKWWPFARRSEHITYKDLLYNLGDMAANVHTVIRFEECRHSPWMITVFKSPKNFTLKGWVEEQRERARLEIQSTIQAIDAEGVQREPNRPCLV